MKFSVLTFCSQVLANLLARCDERVRMEVRSNPTAGGDSSAGYMRHQQAVVDVARVRSIVLQHSQVKSVGSSRLLLEAGGLCLSQPLHLRDCVPSHLQHVNETRTFEFLTAASRGDEHLIRKVRG